MATLLRYFPVCLYFKSDKHVSDEDLKALESKLKSRLKTLNKQIRSHNDYLSKEPTLLTINKSVTTLCGEWRLLFNTTP